MNWRPGRVCSVALWMVGRLVGEQRCVFLPDSAHRIDRLRRREAGPIFDRFLS